MHVRAGDTRHPPQCLQGDDGAGQGRARAARPHGEGLLEPRPDHEARGRHNLCDITYLRTTGGFIYPAVVMDPCTRMVVGWSIRENMRAGLVVAAPEMARSRGRVAGGAMFHSDRGSQYTSAGLAAWAAAHDVRLSVGRTGSCHDNAVAESFFGTPRNEWHRHERPADASSAKRRAIEFIESYYNRFRPHESIGDRVPAEAMQEFFDRFESALQADPEAMLAA